jgi:hypothetical protein
MAADREGGKDEHWRRLYALVLAALVVEIAVLFAVTRAFP